MIDLELVRCVPPGFIATALDVNIDRGTRSCGVCLRDAGACTLGSICPHCGHSFGWFQLLTDVTAIGTSPRSEKTLTAYIQRYKSKQEAADLAEGGAYGEPCDY